MTRAEHLAWAKRRALEYLEAGDLTNAVQSMASDMGKHSDTDGAHVAFLTMIGLSDAQRGDARAVRHWIEGWN